MITLKIPTLGSGRWEMNNMKFKILNLFPALYRKFLEERILPLQIPNTVKISCSGWLEPRMQILLKIGPRINVAEFSCTFPLVFLYA